MIQRIALLLAAISLIAAPAIAGENLKDLIALADKLNELCRGLPGDTPHLDDICDARDMAFAALCKRGYTQDCNR
jgi:hypothetical protein